MARNRPLPLADEWDDPDSYIEALLSFATSNKLFINLCGGVHILDFLTREPDLYTALLPEDWIAFFNQHDTQDIIRLLLREDIAPLREPGDATRTWNGGAFPPATLLDYIYNVRRLTLRREFSSTDLGNKTGLTKHVAMGMKKKKLHEVQHFSRYVAGLSETVEQRRGEPVSHIVDFGSGQNYLGRTLASSPYHKHIIAIERKHQYISGAKDMDVFAKLAEKEKKDQTYVINNKKNKTCNACDGTPEIADSEVADTRAEESDGKFGDIPAREVEENIEDVTIFKMLGEITLEPDELLGFTGPNAPRKKAEEPIIQARGTLSYIEHEIQDGYLEPIIDHVVNPTTAETQNEPETSITEPSSKEGQTEPRVMVVSLHSCGNLVHHGVRSLILNPSVVAVAMIGCCYNLMTERLGPATYKLPILRSVHPRLYETGTSYDPHGFPMSKLYENYKNAGTDGMKLNITARSMAVQAPYNWGYADSEGFFTRNFYRALLQRILVDCGVVPKPGAVKDLYEESNGSAAVIIGSLGKSAFKSFPAYMRAAVVKLARDPNHGIKVTERVGTMSDEDFQRYDTKYQQARKNLSVVWSLMAFSAQVVETVIVVDRWQYLREHDSVKECWVEPVFDYSESPRNLAVIGLKK
ncbi:hypothetical protein N7520_010543 [Penicillium odoratum]|uniref:uncharacterized protein n=1 Tax=Penicillium odoratum TaxID=1167516 RepID=UPI002546E2F8|nr:uncharacterized protein N7520_010543 [Penicillium odoratum]KAJ5745361.1 hypothetical protein N7520_010543 [Penicillium odoratum]